MFSSVVMQFEAPSIPLNFSEAKFKILTCCFTDGYARSCTLLRASVVHGALNEDIFFWSFPLGSSGTTS